MSDRASASTVSTSPPPTPAATAFDLMSMLSSRRLHRLDSREGMTDGTVLERALPPHSLSACRLATSGHRTRGGRAAPCPSVLSSRPFYCHCDIAQVGLSENQHARPVSHRRKAGNTPPPHLYFRPYHSSTCMTCQSRPREWAGAWRQVSPFFRVFRPRLHL